MTAESMTKYSALFALATVTLWATPALSEPLPQVAIARGDMVSEERVSRTGFRYTYSVEIENAGFSAGNVVATLSSSAPPVSVVDGSLSLGFVPAGFSPRADVTFTIDVDRNIPFDPSALVWSVEGDFLDDGTLAGIDGDADGIRDDVEERIASLNYTVDQENALRQLAMSMQEKVLAGSVALSEPELEQLLIRSDAAVQCVGHIFGDDARREIARLEIRTYNRIERSNAAAAHEDEIAGRFLQRTVNPEDACAL